MKSPLHTDLDRFRMRFLLLLFSGILLLPTLRAQPACVRDVCCCDDVTNLGVPSGTFQDSPLVSPGTLRTFFAGEQYASWTVVSGTFDLKGPNYFNLAQGNPNGKSQFIDLNGQSPGVIATTITGMTPGITYTLVLWYALNPAADTAGCTLTVAGGAWVNDYWIATNPGNVGWLERCLTFVAQAPDAELRLSGDGQYNPLAGMLLDDIALWACPVDSISPQITAFPPSPLVLECSDTLPGTDYPPTADNCSNPVEPTFFSEQMTPDSCMYTLLRTWVVSDACGNTATATQEIRVQDTQAPVFDSLPRNLTVACGDDYPALFTQWLNNHGNASATDNCSPQLTWSAAYNLPPDGACAATVVTFTVADNCGNTQTAQASFLIEDITPPQITRPAQNDTVFCTAAGADSLAVWLSTHGGALANDPCGPLTWTHDFAAADSTALVTEVTFTATDACGNSSSTTAFFLQPFVSDTIRLFDDTCDPALAGSDTSKTFLGNCETVTVLTTILLPSNTTNLDALTCLPDSVGIYVQSLTNQYGCDSTVITDVVLAPLPTMSVDVSDFLGFGVSCFGSNDGSAEASTAGVSPFAYFWSQGGGPGPVVGDLSAGSYAATVSDANGCRDSIAFKVTEPPVLDAQLTITELDCVDNPTGSIAVAASGGVDPYQFALENEGLQSDSLFVGLAAGTYEVSTEDANGCLLTVSAFIPELVPVLVDLGPDRSIELGDETLLSATLNHAPDVLTSVVWTPADTAVCPLCLTRRVAPAVTTTYAIRVQDNKGCVSEDSLLVEVVRQIRVFVPNAFSPDDDGLSDEFLLFAKPGQVQAIQNLTVYDRWGNQVFQRQNIAPNDPLSGWDGKNNGEKMNPGVFMWYAEVLFVDGTTERFSGDVTLVR